MSKRRAFVRSPMSMITCLRCRYRWVPRVEEPRQCPACKSPRWNEPKREKQEHGMEPVREGEK